MSQEKPAPKPASRSPGPAPIGEPKPVKLDRPRDASGQLADTIPVPPVAPAGPLPRLVDQNERAPAGVKRFAIRCIEPQRPKRYLLAHNQEEAEAHYRRYASLGQESLVVVALPD